MVALAVTGAAGAAELAYAERTSNYTSSTTTAATATEIVAASAVTADGTERVCVELSAPYFSNGSTSSSFNIQLYDSSTDLGRIAHYIPANTAVGALRIPLYGRFCHVPTAGSHTYRAMGWHTNSAGSVFGSTGGTGTDAPIALTVSSNAASGGGATELDDLSDVTIVSPIDGAVLKYDEGTSQWEVATDDAGGEGGSSGPITLSAGDRERLDLNWWGVWAIVGLLLVLMIAPQLMSVMRVTRGMADGRG